VELTPRTAPDPSTPTSAPRRRSWWAYGLLAAVLVAVGIVAYQGLTSASLYFYNVDEAVAQRTDLGDKRIRVQGVVQDDVETTDDGVTFTMSFNDADIRVVHQGDPPEMFAPGVPVVLEGRWDPSLSHFQSDQILVKHDEQYEADHSDRISDAKDGQSDEPDAP
jgi:cytochrome c-type biogenesis protein CcmE